MNTHGENWKRPWVGDGLHRNAVTGKPYRGVNVMLTGLSGFGSAHWATYQQWSQLGAQVRKGEKATKIVFWKPVVNRDEETDETKTGLIAREYSVFNIEQVDNAPPLTIQPLPTIERHAICEDVIAMTGARIDHRGDRAFYSPQTDLIVLPKIEQFTSAEGYYSTAWHEITHWSGHPSRLDPQPKRPLWRAVLRLRGACRGNWIGFAVRP